VRSESSYGCSTPPHRCGSWVKKSFSLGTAACSPAYREDVTATVAHESLAGVRVLVVEDDASLAEQLRRGLTRAGCAIQVVGSAAAALAAEPNDMVLLDLGLPDVDGVDLCERLRRRSDVPIIVVTARHAEYDRVRALDSGADDYVTKPFGFAELMARMRAVLRRVDRDERTVLRHGPLVMDLNARRVELGGEPIALTPKEFDILACLASEPHRVISREEIFDRAWDENWYGPMKVLDVHVAALRRKLGDPGLIETVYGRGFRLGSP
jgi:DNA-binding response OmpR family regulator